MRSRFIVVSALVLLTACADAARHPLDDSETKPSTLEAAVEEANDEMDELDAAALAGSGYTASEWTSPAGCGISPDHPEQGEVSRLLERSYEEPPAGATQASVLGEAAARWDSAGHSVGEGSQTMEEQRIVRIHGISYAVASVDAGIDVRAFLPCY